MKIVLISSMLPSGHYSQVVAGGYHNHPDCELLVYTDKSQKNLELVGCGHIKLVWSKSPAYVFQILKQLIIDRPKIVHLQHEINMYGGGLTSLLFPVLVLFARLLRFQVITTVHAVVYIKQIDRQFVAMFGRDSKIIKPILIKPIFYFLYNFICKFSNKVIVHTNLTKHILIKDYGVSKKKINVFPIAIPYQNIDNSNKGNYFFYFGYMVRRKGLDFLLSGFKKFIESNPDSGFKLVLAGGKIKGQEEAYDEVVLRIHQLGLMHKVVIHGYIGAEEQDRLYKGAYLVVIPAILSMGSSGPLFHSVSYGKAVICSNIGHFKEDVINNVTGLLVDNEKWCDALTFAVNNPGLIKEIESNVAKKAYQRTPGITIQRYLDLYKNQKI